MAKVEFYGAEWCPYSQRARSLLDKKGLAYDYIDVDGTDGAREEMQKRGGGHTIPQVFIDGRPMGGSDELHALEETGELDELVARAA